MKFLFPLSFIVLITCNCNNKELKPYVFTAIIYLKDFDSLQLNHDSTYLKELSYVLGIKFISKEDAKKKYMADGNNDWSKVLDYNPLPDAYEIKIHAKKFSDEDRQHFKSEVMNNIKNCSEIAITSTPMRE